MEPATFRLVAQCFNQQRYRVFHFVINVDGKGKTLIWPYVAMKIYSGLQV